MRDTRFVMRVAFTSDHLPLIFDTILSEIKVMDVGFLASFIPSVE